MGPAVLAPVFITAWCGSAVAIGSRAISAAVASSNYVSYKL